MRHYLWIFVMLCGCGEPILKNAPKPDPGAVAGAAAAAAAAATLADPQGAGRRQEQATRSDPDNRGVEVKETAPADAIDRLDHPRDAGTDAAQPAQAAPRSPSSAPAPVAVPPPAAIPLPAAPPP
jgi:hypothetical protein